MEVNRQRRSRPPPFRRSSAPARPTPRSTLSKEAQWRGSAAASEAEDPRTFHRHASATATRTENVVATRRRFLSRTPHARMAHPTHSRSALEPPSDPWAAPLTVGEDLALCHRAYFEAAEAGSWIYVLGRGWCVAHWPPPSRPLVAHLCRLTSIFFFLDLVLLVSGVAASGCTGASRSPATTLRPADSRQTRAPPRGLPSCRAPPPLAPPPRHVDRRPRWRRRALLRYAWVAPEWRRRTRRRPRRRPARWRGSSRAAPCTRRWATSSCTRVLRGSAGGATWRAWRAPERPRSRRRRTRTARGRGDSRPPRA